jgi:hypothetical protein
MTLCGIFYDKEGREGGDIGVSEVFRKNKKGCFIIPDDNIT